MFLIQMLCKHTHWHTNPYAKVLCLFTEAIIFPWQSIALWKYSCYSLEMSGVYLLWLTRMVYIRYLYEWGNNMLQIFSVFETRNDRGTNHRPVDWSDECKSFSILLDWWTTNGFHQLGTTGERKWTLFYNIKHIKLYSCMPICSTWPTRTVMWLYL